MINYYMVKYKDFVEANGGGVMRHYFRHDAGNEFTVWTIKSPKTKPRQGTNTDPYAYTVRKLYESEESNSTTSATFTIVSLISAMIGGTIAFSNEVKYSKNDEKILKKC